MPTPDEYRSLDLEGAARSGVARSSNALGNTVVVGIPLVAVAFVGWRLYLVAAHRRQLMTAADKEEFNPQQYPGPGLPAERPNLDLGRMRFRRRLAASRARFPRRQSPRRRLWRRRPFPTPRPKRTMTTRSGGWPKRNARSGSGFGRASSLPTGLHPGAGRRRCRGERERRRNARSRGRRQSRFLATAARPGSKSVATKNDRIDALVAQGTLIWADLLPPFKVTCRGCAPLCAKTSGPSTVAAF